MPRSGYFFILLLLNFLFSCESKRETAPQDRLTSEERKTIQDSVKAEILEEIVETTALKVQDSTDFKIAFSNFQLAIINQDSVAFQKYIDPERGLYIIEVPGAVPHFTKVKFISGFKRSYLNKPFFSIGEQLKEACTLQNGLPKYSCADIYGTKSGHEKEGCFAGPPIQFVKSNMWNYTDLSKASRGHIEKTLPLLSKTVIHTRSFFKFHFGQVNGQWKVFFIDLSVPCSA